MPIELSEQEQKNREIVLQIEKLLEGFKPGKFESILISATVASPEPVGDQTHATFTASAGNTADISFLFYNMLKTDPARYQAMKLAFMKHSEDVNPLLVDALGKGIKRSMDGRKN